MVYKLPCHISNFWCVETMIHLKICFAPQHWSDHPLASASSSSVRLLLIYGAAMFSIYCWRFICFQDHSITYSKTSDRQWPCVKYGHCDEIWLKFSIWSKRFDLQNFKIFKHFWWVKNMQVSFKKSRTLKETCMHVLKTEIEKESRTHINYLC